VAALEANNFGRTKKDIVNAIMHIMKAFQTVEGEAPYQWKAFPGSRGRPDLKNTFQKSGWIAFA
jgi:hypothetical protein